MVGQEIIDLMQQRLGDVSRAYYETRICMTFLNYAQNFMALLPQYALLKRTATTIGAHGCFIDLRVAIPRYLKIRRVVLGNVATQQEVFTFGETRRMYPISLKALAVRRQWIAEEGIPRHYFLVGATLIGVFPRPSSDTVITIMTTTLPTEYTMNTLMAECELQPSSHQVVVDVATGLMLLREGTVEGQKGVAMLAQVLPSQLLQGLGQAIGSLKQEAVSRKQAESGAVAQVI